MIQRDGILLIDKNSGFTSSDSVRMVARKCGARKAGHTGTLDRFASGLLVCLTGSFTRLANYLVEQDKEYEAVVEFGRETETLDPEGEVVDTAEVPDLARIEAVLDGFRGDILQRPPVYSAVHIDGKRAYKRALKGEQVDMPQRQVSISRLEVIDWEPPLLRIGVACSKGTYIRSLARDIARTAGSCGYVSWLRRIRVGSADISQALDPTQVDHDIPLICGKNELERILGIRGTDIPAAMVRDFLQGKQLDMQQILPEGSPEDNLFCFDPLGRFLGVLKRKEESYGYGMVNGSLRD